MCNADYSRMYVIRGLNREENGVNGGITQRTAHLQSAEIVISGGSVRLSVGIIDSLGAKRVLVWDKSLLMTLNW